MSKQKIIYLTAGLVLGLLLGFFVTNAINRSELSELNTLRAEVERLRGGAQQQQGAAAQSPQAGADGGLPTLSDEQLRNAIAKADANPDDANMQRLSGQSLYLYAGQKGNTAILPDVVRILKRAHNANPKDFLTAAMLGDSVFQQARVNNDPAGLSEARTYFQRASELRPDDANVHTSLGWTYFYGTPSDPQRAISEYRKALRIDPQHEASLQSLVAALIATNNFTEAEKRLGELEKVNASNEELSNLRAQLAQRRNEAKERD